MDDFERELYQLVDVFTSKLSKWQYNQYVSKIRDYFIPYLLKEKRRKANTVRILFETELVPSDIIECCAQYMLKNDGVTSESSADDFLIAVNQFFDIVLAPRYPNQNLISIRPFNKLGMRVLEMVQQEGKKLEKAFKFQPITGEQYEWIISNLHNNEFITRKDKQVQIILELILLFGFSIGRIQQFKKDNIFENGRILSFVSYKYSIPQKFSLELPIEVSNNINSYLSEYRHDKYDWLFITDEFSQVQASFTWVYLQKIRESFKSSNELEKADERRFSNTGISMYAINEMLQKGINSNLIMDLTGQGKKIIESCQNDIYSNNQPRNQNSFLNYKIRGIDTYNAFQLDLL